jgi:hypothetical protein
MTLTPVANFLKLFQRNLHCYWCITQSFDTVYAARGVNYIEKSFMTLAPVTSFLKLFQCN